MDPTQQPPAPPVPPVPQPKVSLAKLAADFLGFLDDESLPEGLRAFGGPCRQLALHVQQLAAQIGPIRDALKKLSAARMSDLKHIDENFQQVAALLEQLGVSAGEPPPGGADEQAAQAQGGQDEAPGEPRAAAPPAEQPLAPPVNGVPRMPRRQRPGAAS